MAAGFQRIGLQLSEDIPLAPLRKPAETDTRHTPALNSHAVVELRPNGCRTNVDHFRINQPKRIADMAKINKEKHLKAESAGLKDPKLLGIIGAMVSEQEKVQNESRCVKLKSSSAVINVQICPKCIKI